jgi:hypothetical protein
MSQTTYTIERDAVHTEYQYEVREQGQYDRNSVLSGQDYSRVIDGYPTLEEAKANYPTATVLEEGQSSRISPWMRPSLDYLPGEEWDDNMQMYRY